MNAVAQSERMAEGFLRLWRAVQREKGKLALPAAELTTTQAFALATIVTEGPLRMGALAERLGVTVATASRTVDALASRGLVAREPDPSDARAVQVTATRDGRIEHKRRRARFVRALESLSEELGETERRQLADALETLADLFG